MDTEKTPLTLLWFGIPFDVLELFRTASSIIMVFLFFLGNGLSAQPEVSQRQGSNYEVADGH